MGYSWGETERQFPAPPSTESEGLGVFHQQAFEFFPCNKNMTSPLPTPCLCLSVSPVDRQTEGHFSSWGELGTEHRSLGYGRKTLCFAIPRSHIILMLHMTLLENLGFITHLLPRPSGFGNMQGVSRSAQLGQPGCVCGSWCPLYLKDSQGWPPAAPVPKGQPGTATNCPCT